MNKILILIAGIIMLFLSGCTGKAGSDAKEKIMIYVSGPAKMAKMIEKQFEKKHGDVVDLYHTETGPLKQKIWTEMEAGAIQADVIFGSDPLMYLLLEKRGVLEKCISSEYESLKEEYKTENRSFIPISGRYGVIAYNRDNVKKEDIPKSWLDLKD